jgi:hypothetical protein
MSDMVSSIDHAVPKIDMSEVTEKKEEEDQPTMIDKFK